MFLRFRVVRFWGLSSCVKHSRLSGFSCAGNSAGENVVRLEFLGFNGSGPDSKG